VQQVLSSLFPPPPSTSRARRARVSERARPSTTTTTRGKGKLSASSRFELNVPSLAPSPSRWSVDVEKEELAGRRGADMQRCGGLPSRFVVGDAAASECSAEEGNYRLCGSLRLHTRTSSAYEEETIGLIVQRDFRLAVSL